MAEDIIKWLILGTFVLISSTAIYLNFGLTPLILHLIAWAFSIYLVTRKDEDEDHED